jgi:hypothetical protein
MSNSLSLYINVSRERVTGDEKYVPEECQNLNDVSRVGVRQPCLNGCWVHVHPWPDVCRRCLTVNGVIKE